MMEYSLSYFEPARWWADAPAGRNWVYDTKVKQISASWDDIVSLLSTHIIEEVKQNTPMFNGVLWKDLSDETTDIVEWNGNTFVRKCEPNMINTSLLILDYDDGETMDDIIDNLKSFTHCGYTSHSHSEDKDMFRVIIPLLTPIPANLLTPKGERSILPALNDLFGNMDETSFDRARSFFFPSCPESRKHLAFTWHINGRLFDWTSLEVTERTVPTPDYSTSSAQSDIVGLFKRAGMYIGKASSGRHDALCPWRDTHTHDVDTGFAIWDGQGFSCKHSHCKNRTYKEFVDFFIDHLGEDQAMEFGLMTNEKYKLKKSIETGKITKQLIHEKLMGRL